jgi:hypothetical protein
MPIGDLKFRPTAVAEAKMLHITPSAATQAGYRGEAVAATNKLELVL